MAASEAPAPNVNDVSAARAGDRPGDGGGADRWVIHASQAWTDKYLELEKPDAANRLMAHMQDGPWNGYSPIYVAAHRRRYARTAGGDVSIIQLAPGLIAAGELFGGDADGAFQSGRAAAEAF